MEFTQQNPNKNTVVSIDESTITLSHTQLKIPCFVSSKKVEEVSISSLEEISKEALFPLLRQESLDLLIIGTGKKSKFLSPKQQVSISELGFSNIKKISFHAFVHPFSLKVPLTKLLIFQE